MSKGAIQFSTDDEYYTPKELVERFGQFDYDPATTDEKAAEFGIKCYDTKETNGLIKNWSSYKRIWINPPFTMKKEFISKAQETYDNCNSDIYILLPIMFLTTKMFHKYVKGAKIYLPNGRIKFESGNGKLQKGSPFGSVIIKLQNKWELEILDISNL